jgi:hypothetical protein
VAKAVAFRTGRVAVHEDLLNAVSNLVHRHVLRELHDMTGAMLARLDAGDQATASPPDRAPRQPSPATLERKARLVRAQQRRVAATAATGETAAPAGHWPVLRDEFHAAIKARSLSRAKVAADLAVSKGSICGWLSPNGAPPSADNIGKIRRWLSSTPKPIPQTPAALVSVDMASDWPELRERLRDVIRDRGLTHAKSARCWASRARRSAPGSRNRTTAANRGRAPWLTFVSG